MAQTRPSRPPARPPCSSPSWGSATPLVLASASPQRRAILEQLGVAFSVVEPGVEELAAGEPEAVVVENSLRKARAVAGDPRAAGATVLGSDTLVYAGEPFGKPDSADRARAMLARLAGHAHEVHSGIALVAPDGTERSGARRTVVRFRELDEAELDWYVGTGEWRDRAGGYAIQGRGAALVERIEGDYGTVVGLPVPALIRLASELVLR